MVTISRAAWAAALSFSTIAFCGAASAGPISSACLSSGRAGGNRALCGCIQQAADMTLNASDQRLAAEFFSQPQKAQDVRMSKTSDHDSFWDRYQQFGAFASATCS